MQYRALPKRATTPNAIVSDSSPYTYRTSTGLDLVCFLEQVFLGFLVGAE